MHRAIGLLFLSLLSNVELAGQSGMPAARAELKSADGRSFGTVTLTQRADGLAIEGKLTGLPPGIHAIHIHQVGKCEAPAFESADGHFNPSGAQHGSKNPKGPHAGDLPNVTVADNGTVELNLKTADVTLRAGQRSLLDPDGSSLVVHAGPDDLSTDPDGKAGQRIACGVIAR